ncbi:MAG: formate/nitrite family transporter [Methylophaga sp.]|nr:formate/nitrite family transporter [Methylophaga sp.]
MDPFSIDAYSPAEVAKRVEQVSLSKCTNDPFRVLALAVLAGAFIALGAAFYTMVIHAPGMMPLGLLKWLGGLAFCLGLVLVVVAGAELFTGNNLLVMAFVDGKISGRQLLKNWLIVYFGNFVGALGILLLIALSGLWWQADGALAAKTVVIAESKVNLTFWEAFSRGVLCNLLVCLAIWLTMAGRSVTDKILAVILPISAFVALGFEHSVANMFFIPAGMLVSDMHVWQGMGLSVTENLNISGFLLGNLLPVTLGNLVGGSILVGLFYWFIYLRDNRRNND